MGGLHYFICEDIDSEIVKLDPVESRHLSKALRLQIGSTISLLDGNGREARASVFELGTEVKVKVIQRSPQVQRSSKLTIAVAPPKKTGRLEWMLEKCTELGVASIMLMLTNRSERRRINKLRLEKIIEAACKQSGNLYLPRLGDLNSFGSILKQSSSYDFRAICSVDNKTQSPILEPKQLLGSNSLVLIGPEGGFTAAEVKLALEEGIANYSLGPRRLRTETAAIYVAGLSFTNQ